MKKMQLQLSRTVNRPWTPGGRRRKSIRAKAGIETNAASLVDAASPATVNAPRTNASIAKLTVTMQENTMEKSVSTTRHTRVGDPKQWVTNWRSNSNQGASSRLNKEDCTVTAPEEGQTQNDGLRVRMTMIGLRYKENE
jgi:hypothetical protein